MSSIPQTVSSDTQQPQADQKSPQEKLLAELQVHTKTYQESLKAQADAKDKLAQSQVKVHESYVAMMDVKEQLYSAVINGQAAQLKEAAMLKEASQVKAEAKVEQAERSNNVA